MKVNQQVKEKEKELLKKYTEKQLIEFLNIYKEAKDLYICGSEIEDHEGLEVAQRDYYDEADEMMSRLPKDYVEFQELLEDLS